MRRLDAPDLVGPTATYLAALGQEGVLTRRGHLRESWPDPVLHQRLYKSYTEVCIAYATLLGADIKCGTDESPGWTVNAWYCPVQGGQKLFGDDALDVAEQFLCRKCRWVALNKETNEWELVML